LEQLRLIVKYSRMKKYLKASDPWIVFMIKKLTLVIKNQGMEIFMEQLTAFRLQMASYSDISTNLKIANLSTNLLQLANLLRHLPQRTKRGGITYLRRYQRDWIERSELSRMLKRLLEIISKRRMLESRIKKRLLVSRGWRRLPSRSSKRSLPSSISNRRQLVSRG
jgi:hypothetical protein